ncbi:NADH-ubiquinone oxidoreductase-F iron-sulfur binding region domain-containing protein [Curvibacter sp. APW13]|uniref:NADH-ubiquinone oxidoreductase-F iron-sulfur binding region domain-containing protein n=1 Tax=Curvibacter sp. APW13 TaxID=3077236 RepID=UPI0028DF0E69|nr:NADH-ubiquinone oxidoreductase-F iron-sulfur binding region domain-containing protein [Curvibacter sp. APW13]MDT8989463.1 NADH-ubiquinone oxidoreductase-F iron-sulfur binding region domain-containing protein [Curvibacter sp. APW13]
MESDTSVRTTPLATVAEMREQLGRRKGQLKGRQPSEAALARVQALVGDGPYRRDLLIEYLHRLQDAFQGLLEADLVALAKLLNISMAEVFEVASFYHHFDIVRDGDTAAPLTVRVCDGLSCAMGGAKDLLERVSTLLGPEGVRVVAAPCVGRCEQAPVAVVHQRPVPQAQAEQVAELARSALVSGLNLAVARHPIAQPATKFVATDVANADLSAVAPAVLRLASYRATGGYQLPTQLADGSLTTDAVLQAMEDSGLRGLGGAGFPAGRKWRIVRDQPSPRLMAVNIDEGEPGTFKDRTYLERDPHRFLEGMLVAAQVVGIAKVYIYLRDEYHGCRAILAQAIAELQADPPCPLPEIELRRGAGAYICGEESAMIESIEGKRGEPRMRPPYIAQVGLFGRPTLEHNFETLYWVRDIVQKGPQWFSGHGRHGRKGLRSFSVSGRVRQPGVKLAPAGITLRELIGEYCGGMLEGHTLYAYLPGGASGGIFPASLADVPLDFDTLQPHGGFIGSAAVIVLSQHDRVRDAALNMVRFFAHESCGQCTPCRVGTAKAAVLMESAVWDAQTLEDLSQVMEDASICGLGQAAPNPVRSVLRYFPHEVTAQGEKA